MTLESEVRYSCHGTIKLTHTAAERLELVSQGHVKNSPVTNLVRRGCLFTPHTEGYFRPDVPNMGPWADCSLLWPAMGLWRHPLLWTQCVNSHRGAHGSTRSNTNPRTIRPDDPRPGYHVNARVQYLPPPPPKITYPTIPLTTTTTRTSMSNILARTSNVIPNFLFSQVKMANSQTSHRQAYVTPSYVENCSLKSRKEFFKGVLLIINPARLFTNPFPMCPETVGGMTEENLVKHVGSSRSWWPQLPCCSWGWSSPSSP